VWDTDRELWLSKWMKHEREAVLENIKRWFGLIHFIIGVGMGLGIELRSGGDWDRDFRYNDHRLVDLPHLELVNP
jgi:hypothetical protein